MTASMFDLTGKVALITGSSAGIGLALAEGLGRAGASVVLNGRDEKRLAEVAVALAASGITTARAVFDVTKPETIAPAVAEIESTTGPIDILVNNAGMQHRAPLDQFPAEAWDRLMSTNLDSVFHVSKAVVQGMITRKRGELEFERAVDRVLAGEVEAGLADLRRCQANRGGVVWPSALALWSLAPAFAPPMLRWRRHAHSRNAVGREIARMAPEAAA